MQKKLLDSYYKPAEDTFFIADYLKTQKGKIALDIGTGSGFLAHLLSKNFDCVIATDIDILALRKAHEIIDNCICCNAADSLHTDFDLIVCNLPYLPSEKLSDISVDGLREGIEIPTIIIKSAYEKIKKNGKLIFLTSSLANYNLLFTEAESLGFTVKVIDKKRLFFEELILVECIKNS